MKKIAILFLFAAGFMMTSCKKTYTCDCTITETYTADDGSVKSISAQNTSSEYSKKMSKKQAQAACDHEAGAIKSNMDSFVSEAGGSSDPNSTINSSCTLK